MSDSMNQRMATEFEIDYLGEDSDGSGEGKEDEYWEMEKQFRNER